MVKDPYDVLLHPHVTEKSFGRIEGSQGLKDKRGRAIQQNDGNRIEFVVRRNATKNDIRQAFEKVFEVKVVRVRTRNTRDGKHAIITLDKSHDAKEVAGRVGIF